MTTETRGTKTAAIADEDLKRVLARAQELEAAGTGIFAFANRAYAGPVGVVWNVVHPRSPLWVPPERRSSPRDPQIARAAVG